MIIQILFSFLEQIRSYSIQGQQADKTFERFLGWKLSDSNDCGSKVFIQCISLGCNDNY